MRSGTFLIPHSSFFIRCNAMELRNIFDALRLHFLDEKELRRALYQILGFYPHHISLYKQALLHKSAGRKNEKGKPLNNERLEFLGDAVLDAVVGDIVFRHFDGKREGFLTNTRSKLVSRETLGKLAKEMGISQLIMSAGHSTSHNSYMNGNAFEALVGAIYLDRGYDACMRFMQKRILDHIINIDKVAYKEVNFKSKLLEWSQKNRVKMEFRDLEQTRDEKNSPVFTTQVFIEGLEGCKGTGSGGLQRHRLLEEGESAECRQGHAAAAAPRASVHRRRVCRQGRPHENGGRTRHGGPRPRRTGKRAGELLRKPPS